MVLYPQKAREYANAKTLHFSRICVNDREDQELDVDPTVCKWLRGCTAVVFTLACLRRLVVVLHAFTIWHSDPYPHFEVQATKPTASSHMGVCVVRAHVCLCV